MLQQHPNTEFSINDLRYNYVIIGAGGYYLVGYHDIINLPCVSYHKDYYEGYDSFIERQLVRWCFSRKVNRFIHTPFSWFVFPKLYPHHFVDEKPLCFLFFGNTQQIYQTDYLQYLRRTYPSSKIVLYMQDIVSQNHELNFESARRQFDLLLSYDKGDARKYNMEYYPTPMSLFSVNPLPTLPDTDIYFCGKGKDRYPLIHSIYKQCTGMGLVCDFYITEVPVEAEHVEGINYNRPLTYIENLQHIVKTKCILEIMQGGANGYTPRTWESIVYKKHLLTNNNILDNSPYFYSLGHHNLESIEDNSILQWIRNKVTYPKEICELISPVNLLKFIDQKLSAF